MYHTGDKLYKVQLWTGPLPRYVPVLLTRYNVHAGFENPYSPMASETEDNWQVARATITWSSVTRTAAFVQSGHEPLTGHLSTVQSHTAALHYSHAVSGTPSRCRKVEPYLIDPLVPRLPDGPAFDIGNLQGRGQERKAKSKKMPRLWTNSITLYVPCKRRLTRNHNATICHKKNDQSITHKSYCNERTSLFLSQT